MKVFLHHIYEYQKGLRQLILHTTYEYNRSKIEEKLTKKNISFLIHKLGHDKINVFFGHSSCIEIIKSFNKTNLNKFNLEEDFILGTLLGHDLRIQCEQYLKRKNKHTPNPASDIIMKSFLKEKDIHISLAK